MTNIYLIIDTITLDYIRYNYKKKLHRVTKTKT